MVSSDLRVMCKTSNRHADSCRRNELQRGFTLIELMIGLVLAAILTTIGVPSFRSFILEQRMRATTADLRIALTVARSEAVKRNRTIDLKPNAAGWSDGWTIENPTVGDPDILNHKQSADVAIVGPVDATFTPAGRVSVARTFEVNVGTAPNNIVSCMQLSLDGRITSEKGACP